MLNNLVTKERLSKWRGVIRRQCLNQFRQDYVKNQLRLRKGECSQCGRCCNIAFKCPFLTKAKKCLIYDKGRPMNCRTFPLDARDQADVGPKCSYSFVADDQANQSAKHL